MTQEREKKEDKEMEAQRGQQNMKYPLSVFFIIGNEFCERFSYYGMKAILSLYLHNKLHFDEHTSTAIYHGFSMCCYFTPIFGAMLADMFLGKFKTIVYISVIYVLGHLLKTLAAVPTLGIPPVEFSMIGLALIAIGTGGIKPCVAAFGGDQFKIPEQTRQLQTFFSVFYFSINAGSLLSTFLTPMIREDVKCFGDDTCYSLAFGIPALLMLIATVIIIVGKPMYVMKPPQGNILPQVFGSIFFALKEKFNGKTANHWLDLAKQKYDASMVDDVKGLLRVLVLYIPLPIWWALFDQTGSRWTFQATRMNGAFGSSTIKPDQMQVANPFMILLLIPLFDKLIYPFCAKFGFLKKPLQRMTVGGLLTAASFFLSGFLEIELQKTYAKIPTALESHMYVVNSLPCNISVQLEKNGHTHDFMVPSLASFIKDQIDPEEYNVKVKTETSCMPGKLTTYESTTKVTLYGKNVSSILISMHEGGLHPIPMTKMEEPHKAKGSSAARLRVIKHMDQTGIMTLVNIEHNETKYNVNVTFDSEEEDLVHQSDYYKVDIGNYKVMVDSEEIGSVYIDQGGVYSVLVSEDISSSGMVVHQYTLTVPNSVHILWLLPQYIVITVGEVLFSITGLEFSYSQAPESMKSVVQAAWLLTVAFGNLIVIFVAELRALSQVNEFFMFACLMLIDMGIFTYLAYRYTPRESRDQDEYAMNTQAGQSNATFNHED
jgi:solute carrier family 15 oligopeptide transporter 1